MNKAAPGRRSETAPGRPRSRTPTAQQALETSHRLLQALSAAHLDFARGENLQRLFDRLLKLLLDLTQSESGFIAEVLHSPGEPASLRLHALAHLPWAQAAHEPKEGPLPLDLGPGALSEPLSLLLTTGEPLLLNTQQEDPRGEHLLLHLFPARTLLALPCKSGDDVVGMVVIANAADDYGPEFIEHFQPLVTTCCSLLLGWRGEQRRHRDEALLRRQEEELQSNRDQLEALVNQRTESLLYTTVALEERQAQLLHAERMALLGQLVAGIAHEINNPLGYITSNLATLTQYLAVFTELIARYRELAEAAGPHLAPPQVELLSRIRAYQEQEDLDYLLGDVNDLLQDSREGANRVADIVRSLKAFVREDSGHQELVDVNRELATTLKVVWNQLKYRSEVRCDYQQPIPPILGRPAQLNQVFTHLLLNAVQALPGQGIIEVSTRQEGDEVLVRISDTGHGMTPEVLAKAFTPFFTTKAPGKGAGLGLSISADIIARHMGRIEAQSQPGRGSTFTVRLPVARDV
ncbi:sensor histidine kinase [Cystobacter fuscus]|uniref:sensor histidine kinase n=1 Tax=Cystobacter fuscus TaxID=43 RepID=UPI002B2E820D|nr:GAF domain-containing protein [Cystobacter fuscus]